MSNIIVNPSTGIGTVDLECLASELRRTDKLIADEANATRAQHDRHHIDLLEKQFKIQAEVAAKAHETQLEVARLGHAAALAHTMLSKEIALEADKTRMLIDKNVIDDLRFRELRQHEDKLHARDRELYARDRFHDRDYRHHHDHGHHAHHEPVRLQLDRLDGVSVPLRT